MLHSEAEYQSDFHGVVLPFNEAGAACMPIGGSGCEMRLAAVRALSGPCGWCLEWYDRQAKLALERTAKLSGSRRNVVALEEGARVDLHAAVGQP